MCIFENGPFFENLGKKFQNGPQNLIDAKTAKTI